MIKFNDQGIYASDSRLASIAEECLQAERDARAADRAAREAGATFGTIDLDAEVWGDEYADAVLSTLD